MKTNNKNKKHYFLKEKHHQKKKKVHPKPNTSPKADAAVDPPEALRSKGLMEEVGWGGGGCGWEFCTLCDPAPPDTAKVCKSNTQYVYLPKKMLYNNTRKDM